MGHDLTEEEAEYMDAFRRVQRADFSVERLNVDKKITMTANVVVPIGGVATGYLSYKEFTGDETDVIAGVALAVVTGIAALVEVFTVRKSIDDNSEYRSRVQERDNAHAAIEQFPQYWIYN